MRSLIDFGAIRRDRMPRVIVRKNEQDVWAILCDTNVRTAENHECAEEMNELRSRSDAEDVGIGQHVGGKREVSALREAAFLIKHSNVIVTASNCYVVDQSTSDCNVFRSASELTGLKPNSSSD